MVVVTGVEEVVRILTVAHHYDIIPEEHLRVSTVNIRLHLGNKKDDILEAM